MSTYRQKKKGVGSRVLMLHYRVPGILPALDPMDETPRTEWSLLHLRIYVRVWSRALHNERLAVDANKSVVSNHASGSGLVSASIADLANGTDSKSQPQDCYA